MNRDDEEMRREVADELDRRWRDNFIAIVELHGGMAGWRAACQARRAADPDHRLARIVCRLLRRGGDASGWRL